jgi:hypothetical protein
MQSPLLGFNNNVRHRGRVFHIQTEDSGVRHPHVITHLFMDGGRILKTIKTSYAEHLGTEKLAQRVRDLMKEQHKMMFIALRDGQFDHVLQAASAPSSGTAAPPASISATQTPGNTAGDDPPLSSSVLPSTLLGDLTPSAPEAEPLAAGASAGPVALTMAATHVEQVPAAAPTAAHRPLSRREAPELFSLGSPDAGINVVAHEAVVTPSKERPSSGRYAASRPAALFGGSKAGEGGGSIFGEDLISEQSLDEVILSYLSDDLEAVSPKK